VCTVLTNSSENRAHYFVQLSQFRLHFFDVMFVFVVILDNVKLASGDISETKKDNADICQI